MRRRGHPENALKYYVYVSDAKVEMLFAQIPKPLLKRIAGELRVDLKLLSVSLAEKPSEENRYTKLSVVERYIRQKMEVGTPTQSTPYFQAKLPMRWTRFGEHWEVVFFGGLQDSTLIGLTGSSKHIVGNSDTASSINIASYTQMISRYLQDGFSRTNDLERLAPADRWMPPVVDAVANLDGPEEQLEFLARRLLHRRESGELFGEHHLIGDYRPSRGSYDQVLLGTPIYVAQAEPEPSP